MNHSQTVPTYSFEIGQTLSGKPIVGIANFPLDFQSAPEACTLILGGLHGDEPATVRLLEDFSARELPVISCQLPTLILPCCNPDGFQAGSRYNANGVDLNRNFPWAWSSRSAEPSGPRPVSEPESQALHQFIQRVRPLKIVSLHWALAELDADGKQSEPLLRALWDAMTETERLTYRQRVTAQSEHPECPGSLGQWCGFGLQTLWGWAPAMVTLELPAEPLVPRGFCLPVDHLKTVHNRWNRDPEGYLSEASPAVYKMLLKACHFPVEKTASSPPQHSQIPW